MRKVHRHGRSRALALLTTVATLSTVGAFTGSASYAGPTPAGSDRTFALFAQDARAPGIGNLPRVVLDAHRNGGLEGRENSLSGIDHALDSGVVDVVDLDIRRLADGALGVMHDSTVDRVTASTGPTSSFTREEWEALRLDIGSWLVPQPPREAPPTLAEVLQRFGERSVFTVEVKEGLIDEVARLLRSLELTRSVFVNTNRPDVARLAHQHGLHTHLWRSRRQMAADDPRSFVGYVDLLDVDVRAPRADIRKFVASGVPLVWAHTVTTRPERDRALRLGVTGIVSDDPRYVSGLTDVFPASPTLVKVRRAPGRVQVSDRATAQVALSSQSGPALDQAEVTVAARTIHGRTISRDSPGVRTLRLSAARADTGRATVRFLVPAGSADGRTWPAARAEVSLRVTREDLALLPEVRAEGRRLEVEVRLLDSAAPDYSGPRAEREDAERRPADLRQARLRLVVSRGDEVVHRQRLAGADTGRPDNGAGAVDFDAWEAERGGWHTVRVEQRGPVYRRAVTEQRVRLG